MAAENHENLVVLADELIPNLLGAVAAAWGRPLLWAAGAHFGGRQVFGSVADGRFRKRWFHILDRGGTKVRMGRDNRGIVRVGINHALSPGEGRVARFHLEGDVEKILASRIKDLKA